MITLTFNLSEVFEIKDFKEECEKLAEEYSALLAKAAYGKAIELANVKLHSRRELFVENLFLNQRDPKDWALVLDRKAAWIEDGTVPRNMRPDFLKSRKAKMSKDGKKYIRIPFNHTKGGALTPAQARLSQTVRDELRNRNMDQTDGKKRSKLVGNFDILNKPISTNRVPIGTGPKGQVAQGVTGIPILKGVQVKQKFKAKTGTTSIRAMTFRTVSEGSNPGAWMHPGNEATGILDETAEWAQKEAEQYVERMIKKL